MTLQNGQQLGRYRIEAEIGRGGMARVYRAVDTVLRRTVALKVLLPNLALDAEFARRFEYEAITAANLRHPAIVTIYDVAQIDDWRFIAMEYVTGRTLYAVLRERGALGLGLAIALIAPVADALDHAHRQGAVHRDVKPHNILIDTGGRVLLTDFGIAHAPELVGGERITRAGIFMGTPEYISPEQASARAIDGRSDLYSLAVTAYEIIAGIIPFSGTTSELVTAHAQQTAPPISQGATDLPPELDVVLSRALAKQPERRYQTGSDFVAALRDVSRRYGMPLATRTHLAALTRVLRWLRSTGPSASRSRRRRRGSAPARARRAARATATQTT